MTHLSIIPGNRNLAYIENPTMWKFLKQYLMPIFTSETDKFLEAYDKAHPERSKSQLKEEARFKEIYKLRDGNSPASEETKK